jgi:hypothetical protein
VLLGRYFQLLWSLDKLLLLEEAEKEIFAAHRVPALDISHGALEWSSQKANDLTYANLVQPYVDVPVVVLTRHPLDTLLSFYMQVKYRAGHKGQDRIVTLADMIKDPVFGLDKFIKFHNLWIGKPRLCIVRYEDLRANVEQQCVQLLKFIGAPVDQTVLRKAIEYASFENMSRMERSDNVPRYSASGLSIFATGSRNNPNAYHVREGRTGGYRDHLTPSECAAFLDRIVRELAPVYGYGEGAIIDKIPAS